MAYISFNITCICYKLTESSIFGSNSQEILPTTMFAYLVIYNSFVSDIYMEDIADTKYQLHHLHLEKYFIQQKHDQNFRHDMLALLFQISINYFLYNNH